MNIHDLAAYSEAREKAESLSYEDFLFWWIHIASLKVCIAVTRVLNGERSMFVIPALRVYRLLNGTAER